MTESTNTPDKQLAPERILPREIEDELKNSYLAYSMSVIVGRALPDARDGLKPVHRRILYAMYDMGMFHDKPFKKSARIVGECFTKDTLVLTSRGLIPIKEVKKGNIVYTQNGVEEVRELYEMPKKRLLEITLKNGIKNTVTPSQKFKVINKQLEYEWKEAKDLTENDFAVVKAQYPKITETVKLRVLNNRFIELNENLAYLLGQFLSDGWVEKSSGRLCFFSTSEPVINRIRSILQTELGYEAVVEQKQYNYIMVNRHVTLGLAYQIRINSRAICSYVADTFELHYVDALSKTIPKQFFTSPTSVIYALLSGLIDGDGSVHKTRDVIHYGSVSPVMFKQLLQLTQQLGILGNRRVQRPKAHSINGRSVKSKYPLHCIEWSGDFAAQLASRLTLSCEKKNERAQRIACTKKGKGEFEVIPYAGEVLFGELSKAHLGSGWYADNDGNRFRAGIKYRTGSKIRYAKNLREKGLRRSQIIEWGMLDKLKKIRSPYAPFLEEVITQNLFFIPIQRITAKEPEPTYDIQTGASHEFIANGMVVHNCLGKYHPHGDSAVYDSLVRMAQEFSLRYTLIQGQGNFGSIDGDSPAAMRYTECRLNKVAEEMLQDLDKETVLFSPNFDDSLTEPSVLPAKIPNLLLNGSSGIAVGMATNMPPHNMREICAGLRAYIDNPSITVHDLIQFIKGPDFPTGGIIQGRNGIINAYTQGKGHILVQAKVLIEDLKKERKQLIVTEIPYQVNKTMLIEEIAELVKQKHIKEISDIRDESDREGMRIVLELKQGANPEVVVNQLYKHSRLQVTFGIINLALVNNEPKVLTLKQLIEQFVEHRRSVVRKRTAFDLKKAEQRAHLLEGLIIALNHIDQAIALIKKSKQTEEAKQGLMIVFKLSDEQAKAILEMRLQRLTSLEQSKIRDEHADLLKLIVRLKVILADEQKILNLIKDELSQLDAQYGDARKTEILEAEGEDLVVEDLIESKDMVVTISHQGYCKRLPMETYRQQHRGGKGIIAATTKDEDFIEEIFIANTHDYLLCFTDKGIVHWLKVYQIPEASRQAKGTAIVNLLNIEGEKVTAVIPVKVFDEQHYLCLATKKGTIKKTNLSEYGNPRRGGVKGIVLDEGDELIGAHLTDGTKKIILATKNGNAIKFDEKNARPIGRVAKGVRGIMLRDKDEVVGLIIEEPESTILTITENGYGKRTDLSEYRVIGRGGMGVINIQCSERNGPVVHVSCAKESDEVMVISKGGIVIRIPVKDISIIGRNTQGVRIMKLEGDDTVVSAARVVEQ